VKYVVLVFSQLLFTVAILSVPPYGAIYLLMLTTLLARLSFFTKNTENLPHPVYFCF